MSDNTKADTNATATAAPRRGRPKGSRNKPKTMAVPQMSTAAMVGSTVLMPPPASNDIEAVMSQVGGIPMVTTPTFERKSYDVQYLNSIRPHLDLAPQYQRNSGVWTGAHKKTFIATLILRWLDVPKIYLRQVGTGFEVTDGKQRLTTVFDFLDGKLKMGADIPELEGMRFADLPVQYQAALLGASMDTVVLKNYDESHIRHMFKLLQQGAKTNAQENRNASMGYVRDIVAMLAQHPFFQFTGFSNLRLGYHQVASQLLLLALNKGEPTSISKTQINEMYTLLADEETYREALDDAHSTVSRILTTFEEGLTDLKEIPTGALGKGSVITMFAVYCKLLKSTSVEEVPQEFVDNYIEFYATYSANRTTDPEFIKFDSFVGGASDGEESIRGRRDIVLEFIQEEFTATLNEQDNASVFDFGIDYAEIRAEALAEKDRAAEAKKQSANNNINIGAITDPNAEGSDIIPVDAADVGTGQSTNESKDESVKADSADTDNAEPDKANPEDDDESAGEATRTARAPRRSRRDTAKA